MTNSEEKIIDVIIPAYNAHAFIKNALSSLLIQNYAKKLTVYVVNDCSTKDYSDEIKLFKDELDIVELKTPKNSGPGYARQYGIDHSNSKYISFLDADDVYSGVYAIEHLYTNIIAEDSDVVITDFVEELSNGTQVMSKNFVWMHGKMYKREFIQKYNIRFNNSFANEDTGYNTLVSICTNKIKYASVVTYVWKCNEKSITRRNNYEYCFSGLEGFIENICWAIEEAESRDFAKNKIAKVAYESILEIYYCYIQYINNENSYLLLEWSKKLKDLYLKHQFDLSESEKNEAEYNIVTKGISIVGPSGLLNNSLTFNDFLNKI